MDKKLKKETSPPSTELRIYVFALSTAYSLTSLKLKPLSAFACQTTVGAAVHMRIDIKQIIFPHELVNYLQHKVKPLLIFQTYHAQEWRIEI